MLNFFSEFNLYLNSYFDESKDQQLHLQDQLKAEPQGSEAIKLSLSFLSICIYHSLLFTCHTDLQ